MPSAKKRKLPSHQALGVFALEVNEILQATPPKFGKEMGMCVNVPIIIYIYTQQYYTSIRCIMRAPISSLSFQVQHIYLVYTWYTVHASTQQTTKSEVRGSVSRVKTPCEQGLPHYTCYKQSNAFLVRRRRRSAVRTCIRCEAPPCEESAVQTEVAETPLP